MNDEQQQSPQGAPHIKKPKHVVRTYASDIAALQGKAPPLPTPPPKLHAKQNAPTLPRSTPGPVPPPQTPQMPQTPASSPPRPTTMPQRIPIPQRPPIPRTISPMPRVTTPQARHIPPPPLKPRERPGIPLDLATAYKPPTEQKSISSRILSFFTPKPKDVAGSAAQKTAREDTRVFAPENTNVTGAREVSLGSAAAAPPLPISNAPVTKPIQPIPAPMSSLSTQAPIPVQPPPVSNAVAAAPPPRPTPVATPPVSEAAVTQQQYVPPQRVSPTTRGEETREEILARLHAKVEKESEASERLIEESPLPEPLSHQTIPLSTPAQLTRGALPRQTIPSPIQEQKKSSPTPTFIPPQPDKPSPIHTYKTDFSEKVQQTGASTISVLAAEGDVGRGETQDQYHTSHATLFASIGAILLIIGIGGVIYTYNYNVKLSAPVQTTSVPPSLVTTNDAVQISGTGNVLMHSLAAAANTPIPKGTLEITYITIATATKGGATTTVSAPGGYLIAALRLPLPRILANNIAVDSTVGIVHAGTQKRPFFLLHIASYDAAFAGMLRWEPTIANDLAVLYPPYSTATNILTASTTATSTSFSSGAASTGRFVDEVVANHDVRVLRDAAGRSIMLYGFSSKHFLIIARNAAAFTILLNRLNATAQ